MKIQTLLLSILALITTAVALKNEVCGLKHSANGNGCNALFRRWSYNSDAYKCVEFIYNGCGGNSNRFDSPEECEYYCREY